jgi:hypothetical protein
VVGAVAFHELARIVHPSARPITSFYLCCFGNTQLFVSWMVDESNGILRMMQRRSKVQIKSTEVIHFSSLVFRLANILYLDNKFSFQKSILYRIVVSSLVSQVSSHSTQNIPHVHTDGHSAPRARQNWGQCRFDSRKSQVEATKVNIPWLQERENPRKFDLWVVFGHSCSYRHDGVQERGAKIISCC